MREFVFFLLLAFLPPAAFAAGNLEVQTIPTGARIYIEYLGDDGASSGEGLKTQDPRFQKGLAYAGDSPLRIDMIGIGKFRIVAEKNGYARTTKEAVVYDEQTTKVSFELKRRLHSPQLGEEQKPENEAVAPQFTVEISMRTEAGPVPVMTNLSEIIFQDASGKKFIIDKAKIIDNKTPPDFQGGPKDLKYFIRNLSGNWYVIAQMDYEDIFTMEIRVYDAAHNVIYTNMETGSYDILSVYSWELNR